MNDILDVNNMSEGKPTSMPSYPGGGMSAPASIQEEPTGTVDVAEARTLPKWVKITGWSALAIFCLVFFTLSKLPDDRIKETIEGNLNSFLAPRGITLTAGESKLSLLFGISYTMKDVTLILPPPEMPAHIDKIEVSPSLLPMIFGKLGAKIFIQNGDGDFKFSASIHGTSLSGSFSANNFDIGKIALVKLASDISAGAVLTGDGSFSLDTEAMTETDANIQLDLQKIVINAQSIQGFAIPKLTMSKGKIDLEVVHGKGQIKTIQIGRPDSPSDDIKATITADILFGKTYRTSTGSFKVNFSLSPSLLKQFALLDAILASGKQADGSYYFRLAGPLTALSPMPPGSGG